MQRQDHAASAQGDTPGVARQRGGEQRRVRRESADGVEMSLRQPDSGESVLVGELRAFEHETVFVLVIRGGVIAEIVEGEGKRFGGGGRRAPSGVRFRDAAGILHFRRLRHDRHQRRSVSAVHRYPWQKSAHLHLAHAFLERLDDKRHVRLRVRRGQETRPTFPNMYPPRAQMKIQQAAELDLVVEMRIKQRRKIL